MYLRFWGVYLIEPLRNADPMLKSSFLFRNCLNVDTDVVSNAFSKRAYVFNLLEIAKHDRATYMPWLTLIKSWHILIHCTAWGNKHLKFTQFAYGGQSIIRLKIVLPGACPSQSVIRTIHCIWNQVYVTEESTKIYGLIAFQIRKHIVNQFTYLNISWCAPGWPNVYHLSVTYLSYRCLYNISHSTH